MKFSVLLFLGLLLIPVTNLAQQKIKKRFTLPPELSEASGLYIAGPDSLWWHNDGGDGAKLYLTNGRGKILHTVALPSLRNKDWEDITVDDGGKVYIGDFGNNTNVRQDLRIYRYDLQSGALDSLAFRYEDQQEFPPPPERSNFDMEAFFWLNDSLHLFSKNRLQKGNYYCKHYVLAADMHDQTAQLRDSVLIRKRVITGAAISPDRKTVALIGYNFKLFLGFIPTSAASMFVITSFPGTDFFKGKVERRSLSCIVATQYEAVDFIDNDRVYVASEKTLFIPPKVKRKWVKRKRDRKKGISGKVVKP